MGKKSKLDLKTKRLIAKKIKQHKLNRVQEINGAMVEVPEMEDAGGKPFFITAQQFNKIYDFAQRNA